ncbi:hypothetical protein OQA88_1410 [Cercophora sp. LCS_1]
MKSVVPTILTCLLPAASACLLEHELHPALHTQPFLLQRRQQDPVSNLTDANTVKIGTGDRFENGTITIRGVGGSKPANFTTFFNLDEVHSATRSLVREFNLDYFVLPYKTYENRTLYGFKVPPLSASGKITRRGANDSYAGAKVLFTGGIHARERGGPDYMLGFVADLLWAHREKTGLTYGGDGSRVDFTYQEVLTALSTGIVVIPVQNPDGIAHDQEHWDCWRKNRNPKSAKKDDPGSVGIDLNRNFSPGWDVKKFAVPDEWFGDYSNSSTDQFHGTGPLSEPEAANVDWAMGQMKDLEWHLDLHSFAGSVLYSWGHDTPQFVDPGMSLFNTSYDGKRGAVPDDKEKGWVYSEYTDEDELDKLTVIASRTADKMSFTTGRTYVGMQSVGLYPTFGTISDHARYRSLVDPSVKPANGFTVEFGRGNSRALCPFYPERAAHELSRVEVAAGLMQFLLSSVRFSAK